MLTCLTLHNYDDIIHIKATLPNYSKGVYFMALTFWRQLIEVSQEHLKSESELKEYRQKETEQKQRITYMEGFLSIITNSEYREVCNEYLAFPFEISEKNHHRFTGDYRKEQDKLKQLQATTRYWQNESSRTHCLLLYKLLPSVMQYRNEEDCQPFYCPTELLTTENLAILKFIRDFAYHWADEMFRGMGGYVNEESVIGNLAKRIEAFEKS